jgi:hypothetical protein
MVADAIRGLMAVPLLREVKRSPFGGMPRISWAGMLSAPDLPSHTPPALERPPRRAFPFPVNIPGYESAAATSG